MVFCLKDFELQLGGINFVFSRTYANKGVCSGQLCQHQHGRHEGGVRGKIETRSIPRRSAEDQTTFLQIKQKESFEENSSIRRNTSIYESTKPYIYTIIKPYSKLIIMPLKVTLNMSINGCKLFIERIYWEELCGWRVSGM